MASPQLPLNERWTLARKHAGLSQTAAAHQLGAKNRGVVRRMEEGTTPVTPPDVLWAMIVWRPPAGLLDVDDLGLDSPLDLEDDITARVRRSEQRLDQLDNIRDRVAATRTTFEATTKNALQEINRQLDALQGQLQQGLNQRAVELAEDEARRQAGRPHDGAGSKPGENPD